MIPTTLNSSDSILAMAALSSTDSVSLDSLRLEKIKLYRKYIERMNASEILRAYTESRNEPVWREALEIYGPRRIRRLMQFGDRTATEASEMLGEQMQLSSLS